MISRAAITAGLLVLASTGLFGLGQASASPEDPSGKNHATCLSLRDWVKSSGEQVGPCYYDAEKDSYEFDVLPF